MAQYEITLQCDVPHYLTLTVTADNREAAEALAISMGGIDAGWETSYQPTEPVVSECAALPPVHSPWGSPDEIRIIADGIWFVGTPSHGGFWLSPERNALVPVAWREATWAKMGLQGWYEEDQDAWLVVLTFPEGELADADRQEQARYFFDHAFAPKGLARAVTMVAAGEG